MISHFTGTVKMGQPTHIPAQMWCMATEVEVLAGTNTRTYGEGQGTEELVHGTNKG